MNQQCKICDVPHATFNQCKQVDMARKIARLENRTEKLLEANRTIPSIMSSFKEAAELAVQFEGMVKDAGAAMNLMESICNESEDGKAILEIFKLKLEAMWDNRRTSQDTKGLPLEESTIQSASIDSPSTGETTDGGTTVPDSYT